MALLGWSLGVEWLIVALGLLFLCGKKSLVLAVPAVIIAGLLFGVWRGGAVRAELQNYQKIIGQKAAIQGQIDEDVLYDDQGRLDMRLKNVTVGGYSLPGQVRIKTFAPVNVERGDIVLASGKVQDGFGNYQAAIYYAEVTVLEAGSSWIDTLRGQFAASVYTNLPDPQASLGLGFLVGMQSGLPDDLQNQLRALGLTHIVVASGYNLTILVRLGRRIFERFSKYQAAVVGAGLIAGFVAVTGFSPSMSRAALVTGLALAAWYWGRRINPAVLLAVAAAITASLSPLYLWSDLGWWLSFLAFAGVLLLAPLLQQRLFGKQKLKFLGQVVIETISAQILTLPLLLMVFGELPLLSVLANVLVVPLIPLAMLLTFIAGLSGLLLPFAAPYIALPATWFLGYITELVRLFGQIPWAVAPLPISPLVMLGCYAAILATGIILQRKTKHHFQSGSVVE